MQANINVARMNLINYLYSFIDITREIKLQKRFNKKFLEPVVIELEAKHQGKFRPEQLKKIFNYYGLFIPSVLCSSFKKLAGKKLTENERKLATLFGILTPVIDDLFDIDNLSVQEIRTITLDPYSYQPKIFTAAVARDVGMQMLDNVAHLHEFKFAIKDIFETQIDTLKQVGNALPCDELEKITFRKGGYSVVLYHQLLEDIADEKMKHVLFLVGSLMQFANDAFDIYKDLQEGIVTLTTHCHNYEELKEKYLDKVKETNHAIQSIPYPNKRKEQFTIKMYGVIAQGVVALDNMIKHQQKLGAPVDCSRLSRKQLVVDMQKPRNVLRWIYYAYKLPGLK